MKRNSIQLSIPTPCNESWQSMTPDTKGRFYQNCQKTVIATMITTLTFTAPVVHARSSSDNVQPMTDIQTTDRSKDTLPIIRGSVTDSTNKPIPGVSIQIQGYHMLVMTDEKGNFSFRLPADFHNKKAALHIQSQGGYIARDITVFVTKTPNIGNIILASDGTPPPEVIVFVACRSRPVRIKQPSFWQRTKRKVTGTFHSILFM